MKPPVDSTENAPVSAPATPTAPRRALWRLAWPMAAELLLGIAVGLAGVALAARVSDDAAAAYGVGNTVFAAFFIAFRIVGAGVSVVLTQRLGGGDAAGAARLARAGLAASVWLGAATAAKMPIIATTIINSIRVKPCWIRRLI